MIAHLLSLPIGGQADRLVAWFFAVTAARQLILIAVG
jgi:hypothetical protein